MTFLNIDENIKKIFTALLKKWYLLIIFFLIGAVTAYTYTAKFTVLTYQSSIEFLAYAEDSNQEFTDSNTSSAATSSTRTSETSKMNYAMRMLDTYIEIFNTNEFNQSVADEINRRHGTDITANQVKNSITIEKIANTAMFEMHILTTDADLSYNIALALKDCVPEAMENSNKGLVHSSVVDSPMKATTASGKGYTKKCLIGAAAGMVLAAAYIILRDLLDVRIKTEEELTAEYHIPVLGSIPAFSSNSKSKDNKRNKKEMKKNGQK